ncbi:hypothetical protein OSB04_023117 [Centaurea solstitialis]|uniref:MULE transposase domain-containing protein n=1 Tax=Centaurea solstitialis TaxID=347529 RepID=A0AA38W937_9ASTR|nr:hypothetical protein OSB04_023117 [Centaurea solstitialis]
MLALIYTEFDLCIEFHADEVAVLYYLQGMERGFVITVHFDGVFMYQPLRYENGQSYSLTISRSKYVDLISYLEKDIGTVFNALYFCLPGVTLENGLMKIGNDSDVDALFDVTDSYGLVDLYIDHFGDDLSRYLDTNQNEKEKAEVGDDNVNMGDNVGDVNVGDVSMNEKEKAEESDDDDDSAHSLDHLSEGEDELIEVRKKKAHGKTKAGPSYVEVEGDDAMSKTQDDGCNLNVEHDEFIDELMKALKSNVNEGNEYPLTENEVDEEYPIHDSDTHWKMKKPMIGERYEGPKQLKECITYYALANGFSLWYECSSNYKIIARCGSRPPKIKDESKGKQRKQIRFPKTNKKDESVKDCKWRLFARWMKKERSFQVISMDDVHTCSRNFKYGSLVNYKWIGKEFGQRIRLNPDIRPIEHVDLVMKKYKCQVSLHQCSNAKHWAMNVYEKSLDEHYAMIRSYGDELLRSNPGSTVKLGVTVNPDEKVYFDRLYVCLHGLKEGWKIGCRRVIALDGRDGNNHIFPIAWAVVNVENKDNWTWFITLLSEDLDLNSSEGITLMSDQHKGLLEAVKDVMPNAEHRQCARHIYENFRKNFSGVEFRNMFWRASKASYPLLFQKVMSDLRGANPSAHKYLTERDPKTWSRAFFVLHRGCDSVENGFSECFNSMILKFRDKPIITMLEAIRVLMMERLHKMRRICDSWVDDICPAYRKKLELAKLQQRMWELSGLPCEHSVAAIFFLHKNPDDYVPAWFRKQMYVKAYSYHIQPVQGMNQWPINDLNKPLPPKPKKMPGRPKKKRKRAVHEASSHTGKISKVGVAMTCQICLQEGHNKRSCKREPVPKPPKPPSKKVGRPKKNGNSVTEVVKVAAEGTSVQSGIGNSMEAEGTSFQCGLGNTMATKGPVDASVPLKPSVGGFMSDARRSYQPVDANIPPKPSADAKGKQKQVQKLIPMRKKSARIAIKHACRPISGPGSSKDDAMDVD